MHTITLPIHSARGYSVEKFRLPLKSRKIFERPRYERLVGCFNGLVIRSAVEYPSEVSELLQIRPILPFNGNTQYQTIYMELAQDLVDDAADTNPDIWLESINGAPGEFVKFTGTGIVHRSRSQELFRMEGVFHPAGKIAARFANIQQHITLTIP
jgi:hypothetical protein